MKINKKTIIDAAGHLEETLIKKNHDYGNSVEEQYKKHGDTSLLIRLDDKMRRLEQITERDSYVNESIADTLLDLAGYALLGYIIHRYEDIEDENPYSIENNILIEENEHMKKQIKLLTTELTQLNFRIFGTPTPTKEETPLAKLSRERLETRIKYSDQDDQY